MAAPSTESNAFEELSIDAQMKRQITYEQTA